MKERNKIMRHRIDNHLECKMFPSLLVAGVLLFSSTSCLAATADSCVAGKLAKAGAEAALKQETERANQNAQSETDTGNTLSQCLGSLSATLVIPQFPSAGSLIDKIKNEVCNAVRSKISEKWGNYMNITVDPWEQLSSRLPDTHGLINPSKTSVGLNTNQIATGQGEDANSDAYPYHN